MPARILHNIGEEEVYDNGFAAGWEAAMDTMAGIIRENRHRGRCPVDDSEPARCDNGNPDCDGEGYQPGGCNYPLSDDGWIRRARAEIADYVDTRETELRRRMRAQREADDYSRGISRPPLSR